MIINYYTMLIMCDFSGRCACGCGGACADAVVERRSLFGICGSDCGRGLAVFVSD